MVGKQVGFASPASILRRIAAVLLLSISVPVICRAADRPPDLAGANGETVYFLLGMLDDYGGRNVIEDIPIVESFYCNEHVPAFVFRAYLERLVHEQHLSPTIEDKWRQDCLVHFESPEISSFINGFYPLSFDSSGSIRAVTDKGEKRMAHATLPSNVVLGQRRDLQLAFLAGAYFRYGNGNQFEFANSSAKVQLIVEVLKAIGCDSVTTTSRAGIPAHNAALFHPTPELTQAFARWPGNLALERADTLVGLATADELLIYEEVIKDAKQGAFDGCPLPDGFQTSRFTFIPMDRKPTDIPGLSQPENEALANYDAVCTSLRSVRGLVRAGVDIGASGRRPPPKGSLTLSRVGFSYDGRTAAVLVYYGDGAPRTCYRGVAALLSKSSGGWLVMHYSVLQDH